MSGANLDLFAATPAKVLEPDGIERTATYSPCKLYRYRLGRRWSDGPSLLWILANPSTATEFEDDPTIRRCIGFARAWGYGGWTLCNAYGLRSTDPKGLWQVNDPVGEDNDRALTDAFETSKIIVVGWGKIAKAPRAKLIASMAQSYGRDLLCLGKNLDGSPRHPLYLAGDTALEAWP